MVAHIQEPGANDDASGCGTLLALALALHEAIAAARCRAPGADADVHLGRRDPRQPRSG